MVIMSHTISLKLPLAVFTMPFMELVHKYQLTTIQMVPDVFATIDPGTSPIPWLRRVIFGGGEVTHSRLKSWNMVYSCNDVAVINMYGATECTVHSTVARLQQVSPYPIGTPITNTVCHVVMRGELCSSGVVGELWIGGAGVARGRLGYAHCTDHF